MFFFFQLQRIFGLVAKSRARSRFWFAFVISFALFSIGVLFSSMPKASLNPSLRLRNSTLLSLRALPDLSTVCFALSFLFIIDVG